MKLTVKLTTWLQIFISWICSLQKTYRVFLRWWWDFKLFFHPICQHVSVTSFDHNNWLVPCVDHRDRGVLVHPLFVCQRRLCGWSRICGRWGCLFPNPQTPPQQGAGLTPDGCTSVGCRNSVSLLVSLCQVVTVYVYYKRVWPILRLFDTSDLWRFTLDY